MIRALARAFLAVKSSVLVGVGRNGGIEAGVGGFEFGFGGGGGVGVGVGVDVVVDVGALEGFAGACMEAAVVEEVVSFLFGMVVVVFVQMY
jgi:hypothetical protein